MPYHITSDRKDCSGYAVVKDDDGKIMGCHKTKQQALDQIYALHLSEAEKRIDRKSSTWNGAFLGKEE